MRLSNFLLLISLLCLGSTLYGQQPTLTLRTIDYNGFLILGDSLVEYRNSRLIDYATFKTYAEEENTIILDTRSKQAFDEVHLRGAIHLNFSDFTEDKLQAIIPDKATRILIYCNNNFKSKSPALANKSINLALNIPTFINLYGYGYENIYELEGYLPEEDMKEDFEYGVSNK